ncbi:hypothetical protein KC678_02650 [Candidatus Dojkabacteria bacterium]|uniref:Uncharacterized protein n=1 Tax=Candidatus Dojkabacteria bacterium TaxID=2099670 RepID=A0A955L198_9BACT|nr:hypothetical protein [Candidatus Dojkabacteria bacterium]
MTDTQTDEMPLDDSYDYLDATYRPNFRECITRYRQSPYYSEEMFSIGYNVSQASSARKISLSHPAMMKILDDVAQGYSINKVATLSGISKGQAESAIRSMNTMIQVVLTEEQLLELGVVPIKVRHIHNKRVHVFACKQLKHYIEVNKITPPYYENFLKLFSSGKSPEEIIYEAIRQSKMPIPFDSGIISVSSKQFITNWRDQLLHGSSHTTGEQLAMMVNIINFLSAPDFFTSLQIKLQKLTNIHLPIDSLLEDLRAFSKKIHIYDVILAKVFPNYVRLPYVYVQEDPLTEMSTLSASNNKLPLVLYVIAVNRLNAYEYSDLIQMIADESNQSYEYVKSQFRLGKHLIEKLTMYDWFIEQGFRGLDFLDHSFKSSIKLQMDSLVKVIRHELADINILKLDES